MNNLIDNAVKYNRPGGEIFIEASHRASDDEIRIRDTGIGIAEGELEKIFERFYRVEKSRARDLGGTGLGLSIVKNIVENHGGAIRALPNEGGALFVMTLPTHE
ncbi:MAG: sensor histidine kinase [Candidatus Omnitrophica bacterium]|nr:sensor histidine kinase [Candidatus Omnitrophota bacterium]